ncbi:C40 family peptidase [Paenibacillus barengoltzii]|uniref:C40 family peptidase n=1 Tax=Paenibacillus barengoltzii TaxID=343517 RepID=UPI000FD7EB98|nr:C40 family peptidase [Paenibacillus barengoltzii]
MKKIIGSILFLTLLTVVFNAGSVFASESALQSEVDQVLGTPYLYGGTTTEGFDCSGFIQYVFKQVDVDLPRTTKLQAKEGVKVEKKNLRSGDLVFFNTDGTGISHAGIYMGNGLFSHSSASKGVQISKLSEEYYVERYVTARRILSDDEYYKITKE